MLINNKGFTLVEVIIASLLLFSAITVGSLVYRTSAGSVEKIRAAVAVADALPSIQQLVKMALMDGKGKGGGRLEPDISYTYRVSHTEHARNLSDGNGEVPEEYRGSGFDVYLKTIELVVSFHADGRNRAVPYEYKELFWKKG